MTLARLLWDVRPYVALYLSYAHLAIMQLKKIGRVTAAVGIDMADIGTIAAAACEAVSIAVFLVGGQLPCQALEHGMLTCCNLDQAGFDHRDQQPASTFLLKNHHS